VEFLLGFISVTLSSCSLHHSRFAHLQAIKPGRAIARCNLEVIQFLFMERALASTARPPGSSTMANTVSALWGKVGAILDPFVSFVNMLPALFFSTIALDQTD
jgi:hypothetical protein